MRKLLLSLAGVLFAWCTSFSQTDLQPGDIAFVGYTSDPGDTIAFLLLTDIEPNTTISFTDRGWSNSSESFPTNEGVLTWEGPPAGMAAGTVVVIELDGLNEQVVYPEMDGGTVVASSNLDLNSDGGDQVFAFQGTIGSPNLLAAIHMSGKWDPNSTNINQEPKSHLPFALETGAFAKAFDDVTPANPKNAVFMASPLSGTPEEIIEQLMDSENWNFSKKNEAPLFVLDILTELVLPVELTDFRADLEGAVVRLEWRTASESNNDYMAVERSLDGKEYVEVGRVDGKGTTYQPQHYALFDRNPSPGLNYYRLRQVDFDGTVHYHKIVTVHVPGFANEVSLYPNFADERITLHLKAPFEQEMELQVIDQTGRVLQTLPWQAGDNRREIYIQNLQPGAYFVRLRHQGSTETYRFIKL